MGTSRERIRYGFPALLLWPPRVFLVLGGHMASTGLLTCYIAKTSFRNSAACVARVVALTGLTSIGLMAMVNFIIGSDFKWLLLLFTLPWALPPWFFYQENSAAKAKAKTKIGSGDSGRRSDVSLHWTASSADGCRTRHQSWLGLRSY